LVFRASRYRDPYEYTATLLSAPVSSFTSGWKQNVLKEEGPLRSFPDSKSVFNMGCRAVNILQLHDLDVPQEPPWNL